jgi:uncharacterized protein (TIRG00374 family)
MRSPSKKGEGIMDKKQARRRSWGSIILVGLIIIAFLILFDVGAVIDEILNADWGYLGAATVVVIVGYLLVAVRWRYLLGDRLSLGFTFHSINAANLTKLVTLIPTSPISIFLIGESEEVTYPQATSSLSIAIVLDWVMKFIGLLIAILLTVSSSTSGDIVWFIGILIAIIFGGIVLLVANADKVVAKIAPWLARLPFITQEQSESIMAGLAEGLQGIGSTRRFLTAWLWSIVIWICGISFYYLGLLALGISLPVEEMLASVMVASIAVNPFSAYLPGMYQVLLGGAVYLVTRYDVDALTAFSIVVYAVQLVIWVVFGTWGMRKQNIKLSDVREEVSKMLHQMRDEGDDEELEPQISEESSSV